MRMGNGIARDFLPDNKLIRCQVLNAGFCIQSDTFENKRIWHLKSLCLLLETFLYFKTSK